jgi:hypothetical protein
VPARRLVGRLHDLHDDAERFLGMQEQFLPARHARVIAHHAVTECRRALPRVVEARHLERDVMHARAARVEEATQEAVVAARLEDLDAPATLELPLAEAKDVRGHSEERRAAEHAHEIRRRVGDAPRRDGDVVELDHGHQRSSVP